MSKKDKSNVDSSPEAVLGQESVEKNSGVHFSADLRALRAEGVLLHVGFVFFVGMKSSSDPSDQSHLDQLPSDQLPSDQSRSDQSPSDQSHLELLSDQSRLDRVLGLVISAVTVIAGSKKEHEGSVEINDSDPCLSLGRTILTELNRYKKSKPTDSK